MMTGWGRASGFKQSSRGSDKQMRKAAVRHVRKRSAKIRFLRSAHFAVLALLTCHVSLVTCHEVANAAVSSSNDKRLEVGGTNQGGGTVTSSQYRQQINVGETVASGRMTSSNFRVLPGFLGATLTTTQPLPLTNLDITVLSAKTDAFGTEISPQTWQKDNAPYYLWQVPAGGVDLAGYSYAMDGTPDETVDTTATSLDVATSSLKQLADGKPTFSVMAINTAGNTGKPISLELWIDTTPPQITSYAPAPGSLLSLSTARVDATVADAGSGVDQTGVAVLVNSTTVPMPQSMPESSVPSAKVRPQAPASSVVRVRSK